MHKLPETGYLRLKQILGDPAQNVPPIIPISRSAWWSGIKTGRYPKGVHLGPRTTAWKISDIRELIDGIKQEAQK
jgi:predicted DNA-binding transcriptional regulator AlpA